MREKPKKKRDLISTFQSIERYHQRRSVLVLHGVVSAVLQMAMWFNWYASYARYGTGFVENFFADRIIVSAAMMIVLAGHFSLMYLSDSKDRMVVLALQQHEDEVRSYEQGDGDTDDEDESNNEVMDSQRSKRLTK